MVKGDGWWSRLMRRFRRKADDDAPTPKTTIPAPERRRLPPPDGPSLAAWSPVESPPSPITTALVPAAVADGRSARGGDSDGRKTVSLALQGGGAHGAFTWGVLDRLLEDGRLDIAAVSGASAGAMNGAMLVRGWGAGHPNGPRAGARAALDRFWGKVSAAGVLAPLRPSMMDRLTGNWNVDRSPYSQVFENFRRVVAPYDVQPRDYHPMRRLLTEMMDVAAVRRAGVHLFVAATNVRTGRLRLFDETEIGVEPLLASACLPTLFQAIEIDGEHYWDGGYMANPALFPLRRAAPEADIVVISLTPLTSPTVPRSVGEIAARLSQITFNASLIRELEWLMEADGEAAGPTTRVHHVESQDALRALGHYSKMMTDAKFLNMLRELGREAGEGWLARHFDDIGVRSTFDFAPDTSAPITTPRLIGPPEQAAAQPAT